MAAICSAALDQEVILIEKNERLGKKLLISGHGRCNVTNSEEGPAFLKHYFKKGNFLRDAFKRFSNKDLIDYLHSHGVGLKTEDNGRVLPVSNKASSIVEALQADLKKNKATVLLNAAVKRVRVRNGRVYDVELDKGQYVTADAVIVATGGMTYPRTGSDGKFFKTLKNVGHTVVPLRPALVPLEIEAWPGMVLSGVSLADCIVSTTDSDGSKHTSRGAIIFTHWGMSGPAILSISRFVAETVQGKGSASISLDLIPGETEEAVRAWLLAQKDEHPQSLVKNILSRKVPKSVGEFMLTALSIEHEKKCSEISKKDINKLGQALKRNEWRVKRCRPNNEAMVTQGGVSLKEIDPKTMGSRLIKGLFFAGEMIDIDGDSGGYNIQLAFSTGYLAGGSAIHVEARHEK